MGIHDFEQKNYEGKTHHYGEKLFRIHHRDAYGVEGFNVTIDTINKDIPMIIQKHTNPLNKNKHDMKAKYLDSTGSFMHIGNIISIPNKDKDYMAMTEPSSNGVYSEYKILPLSDDIQFTLDAPINMKCVIADKGVYDEISYINEQNVFEDKDLRAAIIQYNDNTKQLKLFDYVTINNELYAIVKIDNYTFKQYDEEFGVMQIVVVDTPFGTVLRNRDTEPIKSVVLPARVKDKLLNAISREIYCEHNKLVRGDYITFTYDRDKKGTMATETYITINKPSMEAGYDKTLMYLCENNVNLLNGKGEVVNVPLYFEDNRTRIDKETDNEHGVFYGSSYMVTLQDNAVTQKLKYKVNRIMVGDEVYRITGHDDKSNRGIIKLGLEIDQLSPEDNEELGVANYYSQMEAIKPPTPQGEIVELNDEVYLYKGYENQYCLQGTSGNVYWTVDVAWCDMRQDGTYCWLKFDSIDNVNKKVILTAHINGGEFTKTIETKKF